MYCFHSERARVTLRDIGPAVWNGGFSTFLAVVLLVFSKSYVSMTFFKVSSYIDRTKYGSSNGSASEIINCQNWNDRHVVCTWPKPFTKPEHIRVSVPRSH